MYMFRYLHDWLYDFGLTRYLFLDPAACSGTQCLTNHDSAVGYMASFFEAVEDTNDIIFLPYIQV
jgi:hypothetical protein